MADKNNIANDLPVDRIILGLLLMAIAMFIIPMRDGVAKFLSTDMPVFTIAWGTYAFAALFTMPLALMQYGRSALAPAGFASQTARTILLVISMTTFFLSIRTVPLANAISAFFVAPFFAAGLAPFVLGERLTKFVAVSVVIGFGGVLLIMRPDGVFDVNILWALAAGVLFSFYMLATRLAARQAPPLATLAYQSFVGALILTPFAIGAGFENFGQYWRWFLLGGLLQCSSHGFSITAFRFAPASLLAPLVYLEIVAAVIVGLVFFGDWPDAQTWIGIFIILTAGALVAVKRA